MQAGYLVECLGLPGTGKSRLCAELHLALRRAGRPAGLHLRRPSGGLGRLAAAGGLAVFGLRHPGRVRRSLRSIRAAAPADRGWLVRTWLKRSALATRLRRRPGIHLVDAGVAQALWSLASRSAAEPLPAVLEALVAEAPLPDLLIRLEVEPARLLQRLAGRPRPASRLERQPDLDRDLLEQGRRLVDVVTDRLAAHQQWPPRLIVLRNDDEGDLLGNVDRIVTLLAEPLS